MANRSTIECGEIVDISAVAELYQQLNNALDSDGAVTLNAGAIERVDTAALQMFACFVQEIIKRHRDVSWNAPSEALRRSADFLGMTQVLKLNEIN